MSNIFNSLLVCIFVGIFLFIALLYRQTDLALLTFLILLVVSAAKTWSSMSLYRVRCKISVDKQRAFPGETLVLKTNLENAKLLPVRLRVQWSLGSALKRVGGDDHVFRQETGLLVIAFILFSLISIGLARRRGDAKKSFLAGFPGIGVILGFTTTVVLCGTGLILLTFPYLTQIADFKSRPGVPEPSAWV
jgi:hypothetical protein